MAQHPTRPRVLIRRLPVNNNRGYADFVTEADPDGRVTEHAVVRSTRMIDRLYDQGQLATLPYQAATMLRDAFERARISMSQLEAVDPERIGGITSTVDFIRMVDGLTLDEAEGQELVLAWREYRRVMRQLGQWFPVLRAVVIEDKHPSEYGTRYNCSGAGMLRIALDRLVKHFGLEARRK